MLLHEAKPLNLPGRNFVPRDEIRPQRGGHCSTWEMDKLVPTSYPLLASTTKHGSLSGYGLSPHARPLVVEKSFKNEVHYGNERRMLARVRLPAVCGAAILLRLRFNSYYTLWGVV